MRHFIYYLMVFMMVLWTVAVLGEIAQGLLATKAFNTALANESPMVAADGVIQVLWAGFWGPTAQARAIIWGLPMIVFSMVAAITQR